MADKDAANNSSTTSDGCHPSEEVFEREYETISERSHAAGRRSGSIARDQLMGLAFSGGGIRSATFNLGVLQALAELQLLGKIDYLSTVSGGGNIGSCWAP